MVCHLFSCCFGQYVYAVSKPNLSIDRCNDQVKELEGRVWNRKFIVPWTKKKLSIPIHICKLGLNISSCLLWPVAWSRCQVSDKQTSNALPKSRIRDHRDHGHLWGLGPTTPRVAFSSSHCTVPQSDCCSLLTKHSQLRLYSSSDIEIIQFSGGTFTECFLTL